MKKKFQLISVTTASFRILCLMVATLLWHACSKDSSIGNNVGPDPNPEPYPEEPNTIISLYDIRNMHTDDAVTLTKENMSGAHRLSVVTVSGHDADNMPDGWLVVQDRRHQGMIRGITIPLSPTDAAQYNPGDSLVIDIEGGILSRIDGHLQLTNILDDNINHIASRRHIPENQVSIETLTANPEIYESTFVTISSAADFTPAAVTGDRLDGDKTINDGTGELTLAFRTSSSFAEVASPLTARFSGMVSNLTNGPALHMRTVADMNVIVSLEPEVEPEPHPDAATFVITGWMADPNSVTAGNNDDTNHEYIQFLAVQDVDFSVTPYSVIICNNAGQTNGVPPAQGWATGGARTYKINITSGEVAKGEYFYLTGEHKQLNHETSQAIPDSKIILAHNFLAVGADGVGNASSSTISRIANSGLPYGIAVFRGTAVELETEPMDVVFAVTPAATHVLYGIVDGVHQGFRITSTDLFTVTGPDNRFFNQGGNNQNIGGHPGTSNFLQLGGVYNVVEAGWDTARSRTLIMLDDNSTINDIETENATKMYPAP